MTSSIKGGAEDLLDIWYFKQEIIKRWKEGSELQILWMTPKVE